MNRKSFLAALGLIPHAIRKAQNEEIITYGQASQYVFNRIHIRIIPVSFGAPCGVIGDIINHINTLVNDFDIIPPLNALVVRADTERPGDGFEYYKRNYFTLVNKTDVNEDNMVNVIHRDIFNFRHWDEISKYIINNIDNLYEYLNFKWFGEDDQFIYDEGIIENIRRDYDNGDTIIIDNIPINPINPGGRGGGGGEGDDHKLLKEYISNHPELFCNKNPERLECERTFFSSDRVDVYFEFSNHEIVAIECKGANVNDDELISGIFQCIKYRALLEAESLMNDIEETQIRVILVVGRDMPNRIKKIAYKLDVEFIIVKNYNN